MSQTECNVQEYSVILSIFEHIIPMTIKNVNEIVGSTKSTQWYTKQQ